MQAAFLSDGDPWDDAPVLVVTSEERARRLALERRVGVHMPDASRLRVEISTDDGGGPFEDVRCAGDRVFIGLGAALFVVDPRRRRAESFRLDAYFGHMASPRDLGPPDPGAGLLVTSATEVLRFRPSGELAWRARGLGVDGVVLHRIRDGVLHGDAEHDPPGGWRPFTLDFATGRRLSG